MAVTDLIASPYEPPLVTRGDWLECEIHGLVRVGGYSHGRIPWPRVWRCGTHQLIVTVELARAVRTEAEAAICWWWGVGTVTVWSWRQALGVGRMTDGTREVYRQVMPQRITPEAAAKGRSRAAEPGAIERMAATKRGKPAHPNTRAALLLAAKRPRNRSRDD